MLREEEEPRSALRPADSPALLDSPALADSEAERAGIGENFCQPPLPGLEADPAFELPRVSALRSEFWLDRFSVDLPLCRLRFEICDSSRPDERDAVAVVPRAEKKC